MSRLGKIAFLFAIITLLCFAIMRFLISSWIPFFWVLIGMFFIFVGVGFYMDRKFFGEFFALKTTKHGMNMGALIFGFMTLIIVINVMGARYYKTWDFSLNHINSLSEQSVKLLNDLKSDLHVIYIYKKNSQNYEINRRVATDVIRKYQDESDKVKLEFAEADERPDIAEKYGFKGQQAVYLDYNGKKNRVDKIDEQEITSALVKVTREKSKTVYFTTGHGESELDALETTDGIGHLKQLLENNNYSVKTLNLAAMGKIPEDMDALMIIQPRYSFQALEIQALEAYLKNGGGLFVALSNPDKSGLNRVFEQVGIKSGEGFVMNVLNSPMGPIVDPNGVTKGSTFSPNHSITRVFSKNDGVLFHKPLFIKHADKTPEGITIDDLVTTQASVLFRDSAMREQGPVGDYVIAAGVKGPFPGGDKSKPFQMVVTGDAAFLQNQYLYSMVNRDLVLNSVALLSKEENLISITPKEPEVSRMDLTSAKETVLFWGFFFPLPIAFLCSSLFFWMRRRHA